MNNPGLHEPADRAKGASRGLGLGFVRQALERDKYTLILAATRKKDPNSELAKLEESTQGRVRMVSLREVSDRDACVVRLLRTGARLKRSSTDVCRRWRRRLRV